MPTVPGGGTVAFVDPAGHRYLDDPVAREEGGTPAIVESIRAGLVFGLKQAIGTDLIAGREERLWQQVLGRWEGHPRIEILGSHQARRLAVVSFRVRHGDGLYLHHNFVVALLNDLFGIQARGGCSCAGPYGHRLLAIGAARSQALREEIGHGCEGQARLDAVNLNFLLLSPPPPPAVHRGCGSTAGRRGTGCCPTTVSTRAPACAAPCWRRPAAQCGCLKCPTARTGDGLPAPPRAGR